MTEKQARQEGLQYTSNFSYDRRHVTEKAKWIRKQGYRARVVTIPGNPLSRGHDGTGFTIYTEAKYHKDKKSRELLERIGQHGQRMKWLLAKQAEERRELDSLAIADIDWLKENGYELPI